MMDPQKWKVNILLVDDTPANIVALETLLEKEDRFFLSASNGNDALKIALSEPVDLLILDVQMAGMDGFEVAQLLKSNKRTKDIPIIFVSAVKQEHFSIMKGFEEGAVDYLVKPLDPEIMKAKVAILLQLQMQKRELMDKNISLERSALLINNSADIIGILNPQTFVFEYVNDSITSVLGFTKEEMTIQPILGLLSEEDRSALVNLAEQKNDRFSFQLQMPTVSKDKKYIQWDVVVKDGKWFVNARDITPQKIADGKIKRLNVDLQENIKQLALTNKELESFSYSISHDLRAPLRSIDGYSKILEEDFGDELKEEAKRLLGVIQRNAFKMNVLIDDLLEFSRLGKKEVRKAALDMHALVEQVLEEVPNAGKKKVEVELASLLPSHADAALLTQVWVNLVSNAYKYSGKKNAPLVEIGCYPSENEVVYFVKDNGAGFDMKYAHKLFAVFQRLHDANEFEGTGIGLAIVQRIIYKHGGRVWAEGKIGKGATFYFSLPQPYMEE